MDSAKEEYDRIIQEKKDRDEEEAENKRIAEE